MTPNAFVARAAALTHIAKRPLQLAAVGMALVVAPAVAADAAKESVKPDLAKGETIAAGACVACHGTDGNSALPANPILDIRLCVRSAWMAAR